MVNTRKILGAITAAVLAVSLCGCKVDFGTNNEESSDTTLAFTAATLNYGVEPRADVIVAQATKGDGADELQINYEEFRKEYMYYLVNSGITDDSASADVAERCKSYRSTLINSLVNEQVILAKAKELGFYELTAEEQQAVDEEFENKTAQQVKNYGEQVALAASSDGYEMTEEEKDLVGNKKLDDLLDACKMTRYDIKWWAQSSKISNKLQEELGKSVTRADAEKEFKDVQKYAEELYRSSTSDYEQQGFAQVWLPEGSRLIKHVLLEFEGDAYSEITALRREGKNDEADKLREQKAKELKSKQEEIEKKLDEGANIDDLIKEYSADAEGSALSPEGYTVFPNGTSYMEEFQKAAFVPEKIGDRALCVTDYGIHIILYAGNASLDPDAVKYYTDYIEEQLKYSAFWEKVDEWLAEYDFEINYEALRIDAPVS